MTKAQKSEQAEAIAQLREWIKPGDTVYTILDNVSRSGMSRAIRVVLLSPAGTGVESVAPGGKVTDYVRRDSIHCEATHPNWAVGKALGIRHWKRNGREQDALVVGGCGMDMGFSLVYELSSVLYGGRRCDCGSWYLDGARKSHEEYHARANGGRVSDGWTFQHAKDCALCDGSGYLKTSGYTCLGKGTCPSNYHVNHHDTIRCEGTMVYNPDGPNTGEHCHWERGVGWVLGYVGEGQDPATLPICPTCKGTGGLPNPVGPERFDLVHTDGYALRQRWL